MGRLTPEQIDEITGSHGKPELAFDLEATMETVGPNPVWEMHPLGLRLVDREAVREHYRIMFEQLFPHMVNFPDSFTLRACAYGDNYKMLESSVLLNVDGRESESVFNVVITCDDRHVVSEREYMSGPLVTLYERMFSGSFRDLPGVIDLYA